MIEDLQLKYTLRESSNESLCECFINNLLRLDMWKKYEESFESVWVSSSFKGAFAANNNLVPILMHIQNHESWVRVSKRVKNRLKGIAITGWSR